MAFTFPLALLAIFQVTTASPVRHSQPTLIETAVVDKSIFAIPELKNGSCLTPSQDKDLATAIGTINGLLKTAVVALQVAELAEKDPEVKADLADAITVINAVDTDLIANLTKIADAACGTCSEITADVQTAIKAIEETITKIDPNWQTNPIWKAVDVAINKILAVVADICQTHKHTQVGLGDDTCITDHQKAALDTVSKSITSVFQAAVFGLTFSSFGQPESIQKEMKEVAQQIQVLSAKLAQQIQSVTQQTCGTCAEVDAEFKADIAQVVQQTSTIAPDWNTNPMWKIVTNALNSANDAVESVCGATIAEKVAVVRRSNSELTGPANSTGNSSCLNPGQQRALSTATRGISRVFQGVVYGLTIANYTSPPNVRQNITAVIKIVEQVNASLIANLTSIAESSCGTCVNITADMKEALSEIEGFLSTISPGWETNPLWSPVFNALNVATDLLDSVCGPAAIKSVNIKELALNDPTCLTKTQETHLASAIAQLNGLFAGVVGGLTFAKIMQPAAVQQEMTEAITAINEVKSQLIANLTAIEVASCGTCAMIDADVKEAEQLIGGLLSKIAPGWETNPIWSSVYNALNTATDVVESFCGPAAVMSVNVVLPPKYELALGDPTCLTPAQLQELALGIGTIDGLFATAVTELTIANSTQTDPVVLQELTDAILTINCLNKELVANLTAISKAACGTCVNIEDDVNEVINTIRSDLSKIAPGWETTPMWNPVNHALNSISSVVDSMCGASVSVVLPPKYELATLGNNSCLTPEQDKELKTAIDTIDVALSTAVLALEIAAAAEKNATIKADLQLAIKIIQSVDTTLIGNLTKIIDSACGTCTQILAAVDQAITAIEQTLSRIDPDWEKSPIWKAVVGLIDTIERVVKDVCPDKNTKALIVSDVAPVYVAVIGQGNSSCLTPEQEKQLKEAITDINGILKTTIVALTIAELAEKVPAVKKQLAEAVTIITAVQKDLIANLTKIADESCGTCTNITDAVNDAVMAIEQTLEKIDPNWQNNPIWRAVFAAIKAILTVVKDLCPTSDMRHNALTHVSSNALSLPPASHQLAIVGNSSCLTPEQDKQLKEAITGISTTLKTALAALTVAELFEKNATIKAQLETAITVIKAVEVDLVQNLTKIVDESCGTCDNITNAVNDAIMAIEQTLEKIDPQWENSPIWKAVFTAIQAILAVVKDLCPDATSLLAKNQPLVTATQLTPAYSMI